MLQHVPTLTIMASAMLALSAGVLSLFGLTSRVYPGYWWWAAAQWMLAGGVLLGPRADTLADGAVLLQALMGALLLQWPVAVLAGLRRFYARREWRLPAWVDAGVLGVCMAALPAAALIGNGGGPGAAWGSNASGAFDAATALAAAAVVLHLYAAALVIQLPEFRRGMAIKVFAATLLLAAALPAWQLLRVVLLGGESRADLVLEAATMGLVAVAAVYGVPLLTSERTESNLRLAQRKLRFLADMDMLTGIPNRRHFHERAEQTLATVGAEPVCLLMFDIDHFKQINDRLGHAVGDEALRQVARCTRDSLREHDVAGRLGGDEFAVLLPDALIDDAMSVASRIVTQLEHRQVAPRVAWLSLSFGVVQLHADESIADALRRADQALYEAKRQGRARAVAASGYEDDPVFGESRPLGLMAG